jgi:hypothetical protein
LLSMTTALPKLGRREPLHIIGPSYQPQPTPEEIPVLHSSTAEKTTWAPRASRLLQLKALTGKLRSLAPALPKIRTKEALHIVGPSYQPPADMPAVQPVPVVAAAIERGASRLLRLKALAEKLRSMAPALPKLRSSEDLHIIGPSYQPRIEISEAANAITADVFLHDQAAQELLTVPATPEIAVSENKVELAVPRRTRITALKRKLRSLAASAQQTPVGEEEAFPRPLRRSRLKLLKRKLRTMVRPALRKPAADEKAEPAMPRRSRLKMLKRKLRAMLPPIPLAAVGEALPIVEPATEKLAQAPAEITEIQFIDAEESKTAAISTIIIPTMIDWAENGEMIPEKAEVAEVLVAEPALAEIPSVQALPVEIAAARDEIEPVSIEAVPQRASAPPVFLPRKQKRRPQRVQLLDPIGTAPAVRAHRREPLLSSYYTGPRGRRRSAMLVGGCVVLLVLGFVGRLVFSDGAQADVQRAAADAPAAQKPLPRTGKPHVEAPLLKSVRQPEGIKEEQAAGIQIMMPPARPIAPIKAVADRDDDVDDIVVRTKKPRPALVSRNYGPMGFPLISTLVISYGNGKVTSSVEPYRNNTVDNRRVSTPSKVSEPGRPRVVKHSNDDK